MDAIICSAGQGTRLGALGFYMRKSMFRDLHTDKSILWYQLDALQEGGVERVIILHPRVDHQIPAEVKRIEERFPGMNLCCVPVETKNICETVAVGLRYVHSDRVLRLDGDVCIPDRTGLLNLKAVSGNGLAYFTPVEDGQINDHTVVITADNRLEYWRPGQEDVPRIWSCIEIWNRSDLTRLIHDPEVADLSMFYQRVNVFAGKNPPIIWTPVEIPATYEIDTPEDLRLLMDFWDRRAREKEKSALRFWTRQQRYPSFSVDKMAQLRRDIELVSALLGQGEKILEIGAGEGRLMRELLVRNSPSRYRVVEPNPWYLSHIRETFRDCPNVDTFQGTLEDWNMRPEGQEDPDDVALALGWAIYLIHDETLHRNLFSLNARRLILKDSEPPQDRYSRLMVDHFSREVGEHYIALYRSVTEMCSILRHSGWLVREIHREIYPPELDSRYGNRAYLLVAERP